MKLRRAVLIGAGAAVIAAGAPMLRPNGRQSPTPSQRGQAHSTHLGALPPGSQRREGVA